MKHLLALSESAASASSEGANLKIEICLHPTSECLLQVLEKGHKTESSWTKVLLASHTENRWYDCYLLETTSNDWKLSRDQVQRPIHHHATHEGF